jgi:KTSC domain
MQWHEVTSSNIDAVKLVGNVMSIRFKAGKVYAYNGVDRVTYDNILGAESVGKSFAKLIKANPTKYPFTKVL